MVAARGHVSTFSTVPVCSYRISWCACHWPRRFLFLVVSCERRWFRFSFFSWFITKPVLVSSILRFRRCLLPSHSVSPLITSSTSVEKRYVLVLWTSWSSCLMKNPILYFPIRSTTITVLLWSLAFCRSSQTSTVILARAILLPDFWNIALLEVHEYRRKVFL